MGSTYTLRKPIEVYKVVQKGQLAEFFVNEAAHEDYHFFDPVIEKIEEIQKYFYEI